jgi:hypothetical protein
MLFDIGTTGILSIQQLKTVLVISYVELALNLEERSLRESCFWDREDWRAVRVFL